MNVLINGFCGKMGQRLYLLSKSYDNFVVSQGVDTEKTVREVNCTFDDVSLFDDISKCQKADVVVDFSNASSIEKLLDYCISTKTPLVLATTGHSKSQIETIYKASTKIPIFYAPNMSEGVQVMSRLTSVACQKLLGWDIEVIESHHNRKVDVPSGTAKDLIMSIQQAFPDSNVVVGRNELNAKRNPGDIGVHSVRGGGLLGEHKVMFCSDSEVLEISHRALSQDCFAEGAIKASTFIAKKKKGLYNMKNLFD